MQPKKNVKATRSVNSLQQIDKMHPYKMFLVLGVIGISMLFLFLVIAYSVSIANNDLMNQVHLPKMFTLGTFLLVASSFSMSAALQAFRDDNIRRMHYMIFITLLIGVIFSGCQLLGWLELREQGVFLAGESSGSFLYVISGLHVVHLLAGIGFLAFALVKSFQVKKDPIKALVMVTNPYERLRMELVTTYWHYLGALWVVLFFYLLFTY